MKPFKDASLSVVTPVYRNETTLRTLAERIFKVAGEHFKSVEYVFVNDCSPDSSRKVLKELSDEKPEIKVVNLARNFGQHVAMQVGLEFTTGDYVMFIDGDLEESPDHIPLFLAKLEEGFEAAVGKRIRSKRGPLGRLAARAYARVFNYLSDYRIEHELTTMRIVTRRYADFMKEFSERPFMGGFTAWIGMPLGIVPMPTEATGSSNYTFFKILSHARLGLIGFSNRPIRFAFYAGLLITLGAMIYATKLVAEQLIWGGVAPGYTPIVTFITFLMGVQFVFIGLLGEYVGEIFLIVKRRPSYLVYDKFNL